MTETEEPICTERPIVPNLEIELRVIARLTGPDLRSGDLSALVDRIHLIATAAVEKQVKHDLELCESLRRAREESRP